MLDYRSVNRAVQGTFGTSELIHQWSSAHSARPRPWSYDSLAGVGRAPMEGWVGVGLVWPLVVGKTSKLLTF